MGCHFILQGIFLTQGWTPHLFHLLHWHVRSLPWVAPGKPLNKLCCCCCSVIQLFLAVCDPVACNTPDFPDLHHLPEFTQTYVHLVSDAIQPFHFCSSFLLPSVFLNIKIFSSECVVISYCVSELHFSIKIMILKVFLCTCIVQLLSHGWLCNPMNSSPSGSSAHGTFQARILEWVAFSSPGDLFNPEINPGSPALQADSLLSEPIFQVICIAIWITESLCQFLKRKKKLTS